MSERTEVLVADAAARPCLSDTLRPAPVVPSLTQGLRNRRKEGHVVISARLVSVGSSDKRVDKKRVPDSASVRFVLCFVDVSSTSLHVCVGGGFLPVSCAFSDSGAVCAGNGGRYQPVSTGAVNLSLVVASVSFDVDHSRKKHG